MYYLTKLTEAHDSYEDPISTASAWEPWLRATVPLGLNAEVRKRLISNLKHFIAGLEMKAGLVLPHERKPTGRPLLFASYAQVLHFEFCLGTYSVAEGIGSALYQVERGEDGAKSEKVHISKWSKALQGTYDGDDIFKLVDRLTAVKAVRDKLHQDNLGSRSAIDWHAFTFDSAFVPAFETLWILLRAYEAKIPTDTVLRPKDKD